MKWLCVLPLVLLAGCAGILGPASAPAVVAPLGPRVAYRLVVTCKPGTGAAPAASKALVGLDENTADTAQIGLAGFFRRVPIIGWMVGGKMLAREAAKFGGRGASTGDAVTDAVLLKFGDAALAGCEVILTAEPVLMVEKK